MIKLTIASSYLIFVVFVFTSPDTKIINKLVLLRHGESQWNIDNRFTGWTDVDLTKKGIKIEKKLTEKQMNNIANAYKNAGTDSINSFKKILINLISKNSKTILKKKI